jgi:hypothetical protein
MILLPMLISFQWDDEIFHAPWMVGSLIAVTMVSPSAAPVVASQISHPTPQRRAKDEFQAAWRSGIIKVMVVPTPGALSISNRPPWSSVNARASGRPSPVPS